MLVPENVAYLRGNGTDEKTSEPGPAISIFPPFEKLDGCNCESSPATATMPGELAGAPVLMIVPGRRLELPAAAIISEPAASARCAACVYQFCSGLSEPSDIEIISQPLAIAQLIPARIPPADPIPLFARTFPTKICALYAIP